MCTCLGNVIIRATSRYLYIEIVSPSLFIHAIYFIYVHVSFIFLTNGIKKPKPIAYNNKKNALKMVHYRMVIVPSEHLLRLTKGKNIVHNGYLLFFQTGFLSSLFSQLSFLNHLRGSFSDKLSLFPKF